MAVIAGISIAVHAAAVGGLAALPETRKLVHLFVIEAPPEVAVWVEPPPMEIQVVEIPEAATGTGSTTTTTTTTTAGTGSSISTSTSTSTTGAPVEVGGGRLKMRGHPGQADLSIVGGSVLDEILNRPPPVDHTTGELEKNRNGTYTKKDLVFTAKVDADGHVSKIEDQPNFRYKIHIPNPLAMARGAGRHVARWAEDPYGVSGGTGEDTVKGKDGKSASGSEEADGRVYTIISGGFDVTDAIMRAAGDDPYDARKRRFLDDTFDERVQIGTYHRAEQMEIADQTILKHLDRMWRRTDLTLEQKKEAAFELWDECAEDGDAAEGGKKARAAAERWIRIHLEYTADEVKTFNARRRSRARFAPGE